MELELFKNSVEGHDSYDIGIRNIPESLMPDIADYILRVYRLYNLKSESKTMEVDI